jgi:hypothetical protein
MLKFKKHSTLKITNTDPSFENSSYADVDFAVTIKPLTRVVLQKLNREATSVKKGEETVDQDKLSWLIFNHIYVSSDIQIEDENGVSLQDGTDDFKKAIFENYVEFASCLTGAAIRYEEKCRVEADVVKNG